MTEIHVRQEEINDGSGWGEGDIEMCPIALAIVRQCDLEEVWVTSNFVAYCRAGRSIEAVMLPDNARHFIRRFDSSDEVHPFRFNINL